jgi:Leucine-rich repeat (LRR) protein
MVSFKDNGMKSIHPDSLQPQLRWLILTGNELTTLPDTIGRCKKLQKLMLSGNRIETLPNSMGACENLELVRLACNQLKEVSQCSRVVVFRVEMLHAHF